VHLHRPRSAKPLMPLYIVAVLAATLVSQSIVVELAPGHFTATRIAARIAALSKAGGRDAASSLGSVVWSKIRTVDEPVGRSASASLPGGCVGTTGRKGLTRLLDLLIAARSQSSGLSPGRARSRRLCVPKTSSELMTRWNRLSWRNDWVALFRSGRCGLAIQVEVPFAVPVPIGE
jgi:hypothetical protein